MKGMSAVSILVRDDGINPLPGLLNPEIHADDATSPRVFSFFEKDHIEFTNRKKSILRQTNLTYVTLLANKHSPIDQKIIIYHYCIITFEFFTK